jgi:hypothetical protein
MATIGIFSIRLGRLSLACWRDAVFSYVLACQGVRSPMSTDVAAALGGAAQRIQRRASRAVVGVMRPGPIFSIQLPDIRITIGVSDDGLDVFCEAGDEHVRLSEDELHGLVFALGRLDADVNSIQQAGGSAQPEPNFGVAQGIREAIDRRLPPWAREF